MKAAMQTHSRALAWSAMALLMTTTTACVQFAAPCASDADCAADAVCTDNGCIATELLSDAPDPNDGGVNEPDAVEPDAPEPDTDDGGTTPEPAGDEPFVQLAVESDVTVDEGQDLVFVVDTTFADHHGVVVHVAHQNTVDATQAEFVRFAATTQSPDPIDTRFVPIGGGPSEAEQNAHGADWQLSATLLDSDVGEATWRFTLRTDDPFVGAVSVTATPMTLDFASAFGTSRTASFTVNDQPNAPRLLAFVDGVNLEEVTEFVFPERAEGADDTQVESEFRMQLLDASPWSLSLTAGADDTMTLDERNGVFFLGWSPDNDDVLDARDEPHEVTFTFSTPDGIDVARSYPVRIAPLVNNTPAFGDFTGLNLALVPGGATKQLTFTVHDPDEVLLAPTCAAAVQLPAGAASTCNASSSLVVTRCDAPSQLRDGGTWTFFLELTPTASYADCGEEPSFEVQLSITDVSPTADDVAKTIETEAYCFGDDGCREHLQLYTAALAERVVVTGFTNLQETDPPLIDGSRMKALMSVDDDGDDHFVLLDLSSNTPSVAHTYPSTICRIETAFSWDQAPGFVDNTNGVAWVLARAPTDANPNDCSFDAETERGLAKVQLVPPYDVVFFGFDAVCDGGFVNPAVPVQGPNGVWFPCGSSDALTLIDENDELHHHVVPVIDGNSSVHVSPLILDPDGVPWFLYLHNDGLHMVNLDSLRAFSVTDPASVEVVGFGNWDAPGGFNHTNRSEVRDVFVDQERFSVLLAHDPNRYPSNPLEGQGAELRRIRFAAGGPVSNDDDDKLVLGDIGNVGNNGTFFMRLEMRAPSTRALSEPDLLITGDDGPDADDNPLVDLDSFTLTDRRAATAYTEVSRVYTSPLPDYYMGVLRLDGFTLYPWNADLDPVVQVIDGFPSTIDLKTDMVTSSSAAKLSVFNMNDTVEVLRFHVP
jgi:hypothetical protein